MLSHQWSWETGFLARERADCQPCLLKDLAPDLAVRVPNDGRVQVNKEEKVTRQVKSDKIQKVLSLLLIRERRPQTGFYTYYGRVPESPREVGSWCDHV